jgi:hypothetical protein
VTIVRPAVSVADDHELALPDADVVGPSAIGVDETDPCRTERDNVDRELEHF